MGMYTELIFGASLKENTPIKVINTLKTLINNEEFDKDQVELSIINQRNVTSGSSFYFGVSSSHSKIWYNNISKEWIVSTRANIKNYENEIQKFLEWIKPYISNGSGNKDMYAIVTYEEASEPSIYYLN